MRDLVFDKRTSNPAARTGRGSAWHACGRLGALFKEVEALTPLSSAPELRPALVDPNAYLSIYWYNRTELPSPRPETPTGDPQAPFTALRRFKTPGGALSINLNRRCT